MAEIKSGDISSLEKKWTTYRDEMENLGQVLSIFTYCGEFTSNLHLSTTELSFNDITLCPHTAP